MEPKDLIADCLERILLSPMHESQSRQRALDVAEAMMVAAQKGAGAAYGHLTVLSLEAEAGKYTRQDED